MRKLQNPSSAVPSIWPKLGSVSITSLPSWCTRALHPDFSYRPACFDLHGCRTPTGASWAGKGQEHRQQTHNLQQPDTAWHSLSSQVTAANTALLVSARLHSHITLKQVPGSRCLNTPKCRCRQPWKDFKPTHLEVHFHQNCLLYPPSSGTLKCSVGLTETTLTWDFRSWKISFSCSLLLSQSTKISNSEFRLLDFRDSMCTRFTCFSCLVRSNVLKETD